MFSSRHHDASHRLALPPGFMLATYRVEKLLGKGGFGMTYLTRDVDLDMLVAIKELLPDGIATRAGNSTVVAQTIALEDSFNWALQRFDDEAKTLARLNHPNIVKVHRLLRANGTAYMIMEYIEGQSLSYWIKSNRRPTEQQLMDLLLPVVDGLEHLHQFNLLHLDVKPDNILIPPGMRGPVLLDFGSARVDTGRTQTLTAVVSEGYAPFEQYQTKTHPGPWTDIYALCAVMSHVLTGEKPPTATDRMVDDGRYGSLSERFQGRYSPSLLYALDVGFAVRAKDRPATMADFRRLLAGQRTYAPAPVSMGNTVNVSQSTIRYTGQTLPLPPAPPIVQPTQGRGSVMALLAVSAICLLFAGVVGVFLLMRQNNSGIVANSGTSGSSSSTGTGSTPTPDIPQVPPSGMSQEQIATALKDADDLFHTGQYEKARDAYAAHATSGGPAAAWLGLARSMLELTREFDYKGGWPEDPRILDALQRAAGDSSTRDMANALWGLFLAERGQKYSDHRRAIAKLDTASALAQSCPEYHLARAIATYGMDDSTRGKQEYGYALTAIDGEIATKGETGYRLALKASLLDRLGRFAESVPVIDRAISLAPGSDHYQLVKSMLINWANDNPAALRAIEQAMSIAPENYYYLVRRARIHAAMQNYSTAHADIAAAIAREPGNADFYNWRGIIYYRNKDYRSAIQSFSDAATRSPTNTLYLLNRGKAHEELEDFASARRDYESALAIDEENWSARFNRMLLIHYAASTNAEYEQVIQEADKLIASNPHDWVPMRFKANALSRLGRFAEALTLSATDIQKNPDSAIPYSERAHIYERMEKYDEAIADFDSAIRIKPSATLYSSRGGCHESKQDYRTAASDYTEAIKLDPDNGLYYRKRGYCHYRLKDDASSIKDLDQAIKLNKQDSGAYLYWGYVLVGQNNHSLAIQWFTRAIEIDPTNRVAYQHRAKSYRELGRVAEAIADEAKVKSLPP